MEYIKDWDEYFFRHVYLASWKSKDPRSKIGATLVKDGVVISEGYNGFGRGVLDLPERYEDRETKYKFVVHAEANAILNCVRTGIATKNSILYTQGKPCHECSKLIIQAGVKEIVYHSIWPNLIHSQKWVESIQIAEIMLREANIDIRAFDKVLGIEGYLDNQIIKI